MVYSLIITLITSWHTKIPCGLLDFTENSPAIKKFLGTIFSWSEMTLIEQFELISQGHDILTLIISQENKYTKENFHAWGCGLCLHGTKEKFVYSCFCSSFNLLQITYSNMNNDKGYQMWWIVFLDKKCGKFSIFRSYRLSTNVIRSAGLPFLEQNGKK